MKRLLTSESITIRPTNNMNNTNAETTAQNGQFPPITEQDLKRLRFALQGIEDETIDAEMFRRIHDVLLERYGREQISEATDRWRAKSGESGKTDLELSIVPLDDFMAEQISEPDKLISGVLYKGGVMLLTGAAKTNKSWTAKEIGISIAQGSDWLGFNCAQGRVLYVNNEIKSFTLQSRLRGLMGALGPVPKGGISLLNLRGVQTNIFELAKSLTETVECDQFSAIIIDPIYTLLGDKDENDNGDVKEIGNTLTHVAEKTGAAVIFVHHHSKGNQGNKRSLERASGAGAWGRFPDAVLDIDKQNEKEKLFRLSLTLRDFEAPDDFLARRIVPGPRWDKSAITVEEAEADIEAAKEAKKEAEKGEDAKKIADLVATGEKISGREWTRRAEGVGFGRTKFESTRDWLLDNGIVSFEKGPKNSVLYYFQAPKGERFHAQA
jgi:AAA domain